MVKEGHKGPVATHKSVIKIMRSKQTELYRRWNCERWKDFVIVIQIPFWLLSMEAIREMCGVSVGLLGMFLNSQIDGIVTTVPPDPSLATEGMLWFPNLMEADPEMILPFMLSGVVYANVANAFGKNPRGWRKGLSRGLKGVALAMGPLTLQMPSAMLLYWITSSSLVHIQSFILDKAIPVKLEPTPVQWKPKSQDSEAVLKR